MKHESLFFLFAYNGYEDGYVKNLVTAFDPWDAAEKWAADRKTYKPYHVIVARCSTPLKLQLFQITPPKVAKPTIERV